jgi:hypothetical protein
MIIALLGKPRGWKSFRRPSAASTTGTGPNGSDSIGWVSARGIRGLNPRKQALCETIRVEGMAGGLALQPSIF